MACVRAVAVERRSAHPGWPRAVGAGAGMMDRARIFLAFAFSALLATAANAAGSGELQPFQATFGVTWHGVSAGTAQLRLQRLPDGRWSYQSITSARGLFRLAMPAELRSRSLFSIRDGHIVPESFTADDGTSR